MERDILFPRLGEFRGWSTRMKMISCANCRMKIGADEKFCPFCDQMPHEDPDAIRDEEEALGIISNDEDKLDSQLT